MELRYMGFDQDQNTRVYRFDRTVRGEPTLHFVITADLALFLDHRIGIQEGPGLCAHKLASQLDTGSAGQHQLTNADLVAYVTDRAAAVTRREESRRSLREKRGLANPA